MSNYPTPTYLLYFTNNQEIIHTKFVQFHVSSFTTQALSIQGITKRDRTTKPGNAPGFDNVHQESLIKSGPYARKCLAHFYNDILNTGKILRILKETNKDYLFKLSLLISRQLTIQYRILYKFAKHIPCEKLGSYIIC